MKLVTFGIYKEKKSHNRISCMYTALYTTTSNIISNRDYTHSNHRLKQTDTLLQTPRDGQTIYSLKLRNIHHNQPARIKNLQENRP